MKKVWIGILALFLWAGLGSQNVFPQSSMLRLHKLQVSVEGGQKIVSLRFSQPPDSVKAFVLLSPPRLVVDVKGTVKGQPSAAYKVEDSLLWRVRVGSHPQYIRFVLDLKGETAPPFAVEQKETLVTAALKVPGGDAGEARTQVLFTLPTKTVASRRVPKAPVPAPAPVTKKAPAPAPPPAAKKAPAPAPAPAAPVEEAKRVVPKQTLAAKARRPVERERVVPKPAEAVVRLHELTLTAEGSQKTVLFRFSQPPDSIKAFALSSPSRLVVDVKGAVKDGPPATYAVEDALLRRVRMGSHPQYIRFVLDLKAEKPPPFSVEQKDTLVTAVLGTRAEEPGELHSQVLFSLEEKAVASRGIPRIIAPVPPSVAPDVVLKKDLFPQTVPEEARDHLKQGQIFYDRGEVDEAIVQWRETVRLAPQAAQAHHLLGLALRDRGDFAEAVAALQEALRLDPNNATAHVHLAMAFEARGETNGAFAAYRNALQLVPTSPYVHNRLGHLLAARGDWQGAVEEWQQTTRLLPDYAYAYANLGEALEQVGKKGEALAAYERAISLDPQASFAAEVRRRVARLRQD